MWFKMCFMKSENESNQEHQQVGLIFLYFPMIFWDSLDHKGSNDYCTISQTHADNFMKISTLKILLPQIKMKQNGYQMVNL